MSHQAFPLESCTGVTTATKELVDLYLNNPASPDVLVQAARIEASHGLKCTSKEVAAISVIVDDFEDALTTIKLADKDAQDKLLTLTGDSG